MGGMASGPTFERALSNAMAGRAHPVRTARRALGNAMGQVDVWHGEKTLSDVVDSIEEMGVDSFITENKGVIDLSQIIIPKNKRKQGIGSDAMKKITDYADETKQTIKLTPSTDKNYHGPLQKVLKPENPKSLHILETLSRRLIWAKDFSKT
jgi:predicted GNAT family acetyltransferase